MSTTLDGRGILAARSQVPILEEAMPRHRNEARRRQWQQRMARFKQSSQPVARFCKREGVSVASFYNWRRRLASDRPVRRKQERRHAAFQPITITPSGAGVSIHLTCGTRIEIPPHDLDAVRAVVDEVVRARQVMPVDDTSC